MTESYGFEFKVDATQAAKGWQQFQSAVEGVFGALDKMESHVASTMAAVNKGTKSSSSGIKDLAAAGKALGSINISSSAAKNIESIGKAMQGFKAPNSAQISNLKDFFKVLATAGTGGGATASRNIEAISKAMEGFKAPNASQVRNLKEFLTVLNGFRSTAAMSRLGPLVTALGPLANFKAPSAAQVRNLQQFITAIGTLRVPANANEIASSLTRIGTAAGSASNGLRGVRGIMGGAGGGSFGWQGFTSGAHGARLEMMGLQNAFSGTFQVGSLLRSLLGSLTIGEVGRAFFDATQTANQFASALGVIDESPAFQKASWDRVAEAANHFGADLSTYAQGFSKFAVAAHESGMSVAETFKVYEGFQTVMTALHLGTEQQQSVGLAIREIMDRGYVSTQQLTRQLGLVLPGALHTLQVAWKASGVSQDNFFDALKKKEVDGKWALDQLANHYRDTYGKAVTQALESPIQQFNILRNKVTQLMIAVSDAGAKKAFAGLISQFSGYLDPKNVDGFAKSIGGSLTNAVTKVSGWVKTIHDHWDEIKGPLSTVLRLTGELMLTSAAFKFTTFLVSPIIRTISLMKVLLPMMKEMEVLSAFSAVTGTLAKLNTPLKGISLLMGEAFSTVGLMTFGSAIIGVVEKVKGVGPAIITGLTTPIEGGIAAAAAVIVGGLTAAFAAAVDGAHMQGMKLESDQYSTMEIVKGFFLLAYDQIAGAWKSVTEWMNAKAVWLGNLIHIPFKSAVDLVVSFFEYLAYAIGNQLDVVLNIATAVAHGIAAQFKSVGTILSDAIKGDWAGSATEAGNLFGGNFAKAAQDQMGKHTLGAADFATYQKNAGLGADAILSAAGRRGRGAPHRNSANRSMGTPWQDSPGDDNSDPLYHGIDGKGKKGKKGRDPIKQMESMENALDSLMQKIDASDPAEKILDQFTQTITKSGQLLLKKNDYVKFVNDLKNAAHTTTGEVDVLVAHLQQAGNGKALADLSKRYHISVADLIEKYRAAASAADDKMNEAIIKEFDDKFKKQNEALKAIADKNPIIKVQIDFASSLEKSASSFLNPAALKAFLPDLKGLQEGTVDAAKATNDLITAMTNGGASIGLTAKQIQQLTDVLRVHAIVNAQDLKTAQEQATFGATTLKQMDEEIKLAGLSATTNKVLATVLKDVTEWNKNNAQATQAQVDALTKDIAAREKRLSLMQQETEFYKNNGIQQYINDTQTAGEAVHSLDNNFLKSLDDTIYNIGKNGVISFTNLFNTIEDGLLHFASQNITKSLIGVLEGGSKNSNNPTIFGDGGGLGIFGKLFGMKTGFDKDTASKRFDAQNVNLYAASVTADGKLLTGGGGSSFSGQKNDDGTFKVADNFNQQMTSVIDQVGGTMQTDWNNSVKGVGGFLQSSLQSAIMASTGGGGGGGGLLSIAGSLIGGVFGGGSSGGGGLLGKLFGGGGGPKIGGQTASQFASHMTLPTIKVAGFSEGGFSNSPVSFYTGRSMSFANAPHYAEGTGNTNGGHPAILHDNEAVIPLSRGRKVPVELTNGSNGGSQTVTHNTWNIQTPDADSFRKSQQQITTQMHSAANRATRRNH